MSGPNSTPSPPNIASKAAKWYQRQGFAVLPLYPVDGDRCACGNPACSNQGKHPIESLAYHGLKDASHDPAFIDQWSASWPDMNIGIRTGEESKLIVVDLDTKNNGIDSFYSICERYGNGIMPDTWRVITGSGGMHLYFRHPGRVIPNSAGKIGPGIDVRGDGGYVVAPPSSHISGNHYRWDPANNFKTHPLADPPPWLIIQAQLERAGGNKYAPPIPDLVQDGTRNSTMTSLAGSMWRRNMSPDTIEFALLRENKARCVPPLPDSEIINIVRSITRYPARP
jgi:hypothetical protein